MQRVAQDRCDRHKSRRDLQIDDAVIEFSDRSFVFPPDSGIDRQTAVDSPIIGDERIVIVLAQILVRVAERDGTRVRDSEQKTGEIGSRGSTRESKRSSRILLGQQIDLQFPKVAAKREVM